MTSSMAFQGASSSSSSAREWMYDVLLLSSRGDDTCHNFTARLHQDLLQKGISTFIDDEQLKGSGEKISLTLLKAMQQSKILIVVFSQTYASSTRCLNELLKIFETEGQLVLAVFYKVDPSDVRHQKNNHEEALAKHEEMFKDDKKVQNWKAALTRVANLPGWYSENYSNEAQLIDQIVEFIANYTNLQVAKRSVKHPDEIQSPVQVPDLSSSPSGNGEQGNNYSKLSQGVVLFFIASVIGLLQVDYLFETHAANMWISVAAMVMFCLSCAAMTKINGTRWAKYTEIIDRFRILLGILVPVPLLSIHLPHQLRWLFFAIWALLALIVVAYTWIYRGAKGREANTRISLAPVQNFANASVAHS